MKVEFLKGLNIWDKKLAQALLNSDSRKRFMLEDTEKACRIARFGLPSSMNVLNEKSYSVLAKKARRLAYEFVETFKDNPNYHNSAYFLAQDLRIPFERRTDLVVEMPKFVDRFPWMCFSPQNGEGTEDSPEYNINLFKGKFRLPYVGRENFGNLCDDIARVCEESIC
jgi:hypothetical protein